MVQICTLHDPVNTVSAHCIIQLPFPLLKRSPLLIGRCFENPLLIFWEAVQGHVHPIVHTRTSNFCPHLTLEPVGQLRHLLPNAHQSAVTVILFSMWAVNRIPLSLSLCACLIELNTVVSWSIYTAEMTGFHSLFPQDSTPYICVPFPTHRLVETQGVSIFWLLWWGPLNTGVQVLHKITHSFWFQYLG